MYKCHLFICTNSPDRDGKCGHKGAEKLRLAVKQKLKDKGYGREIRVNSSGCLGHCENGIAAVLYKKGEWFLNLQETDVDKLVEKVEAG